MKSLHVLCCGMALVVGMGRAAADDMDIPRLLEKLSKDEKVGNRKNAARELGQLGARAEKAVPSLVKALEDNDVAVRDEVEVALSKIGEVAVPGLLDGLKNEDQFVRVRIVTILGNIGPAAGKRALDALETASTKDSSSFVKEAAEKAAFRVKVDAKTLVALLKDKDESQRLYAVKGLGILGPTLAKTNGIKALADTLKDKNKEVRREAAKTLGTLGKDALPALPNLAAALNDADPDVRLNAINAIGEFGADARAAIPNVQAALMKYGKNNEIFKDAAETTILRLMGKKKS